jgi:hypothetical protein
MLTRSGTHRITLRRPNARTAEPHAKAHTVTAVPSELDTTSDALGRATATSGNPPYTSGPRNEHSDPPKIAHLADGRFCTSFRRTCSRRLTRFWWARWDRPGVTGFVPTAIALSGVQSIHVVARLITEQQRDRRPARHARSRSRARARRPIRRVEAEAADLSRSRFVAGAARPTGKRSEG